MNKKQLPLRRYHQKHRQTPSISTLSTNSQNEQKPEAPMIKEEKKLKFEEKLSLASIPNEIEKDEMKESEKSIDTSGIIKKIELTSESNWNFEREDEKRHNSHMISEEGIKIILPKEKRRDIEIENEDNNITNNTENNNEEIKNIKTHPKKNEYCHCYDKYCILRFIGIGLLCVGLVFFIIWNMR